ncbi:MAG TPA: hypothetical protein VLT35_01660 [Methanocella sp.]|nr:hypothetical protein [Methanocella sp.]
MASLKYNLIEFGVSIVVLTVFLVAMAIAEVAGPWSSLVYIVAIVFFALVLCVTGWKLAPFMYDQSAEAAK